MRRRGVCRVLIVGGSRVLRGVVCVCGRVHQTIVYGGMGRGAGEGGRMVSHSAAVVRGSARVQGGGAGAALSVSH